MGPQRCVAIFHISYQTYCENWDVAFLFSLYLVKSCIEIEAKDCETMKRYENREIKRKSLLHSLATSARASHVTGTQVSRQISHNFRQKNSGFL